jgi:hypothetical protein
VSELSFDEFMPPDLCERIATEATRGRVPFVLMRPDRGDVNSPPQPIAVVFGPRVPCVGETVLWENGETYAIVGVSHRLTTDVDAPPYLTALPLLATRPA